MRWGRFRAFLFALAFMASPGFTPAAAMPIQAQASGYMLQANIQKNWRIDSCCALFTFIWLHENARKRKIRKNVFQNRRPFIPFLPLFLTDAIMQKPAKTCGGALEAFQTLQPGGGESAFRRGACGAFFAVRRLFAAAKAAVRFAMGLIAAKPVKPCDGGVFRPFYLLLKQERKQAVERGVYAHSRRASLWKKRGRVCMSHAMACQTRPRGHCLKNRQGTHANAFFRSRGHSRAVNKPFISRG